MVLRDYLVKNFKVKDTRIKTIGLGKSDTVADDGSVEILVYPEGTPPQRKFPIQPCRGMCLTAGVRLTR